MANCVEVKADAGGVPGIRFVVAKIHGAFRRRLPYSLLLTLGREKVAYRWLGWHGLGAISPNRCNIKLDKDFSRRGMIS
jgi:hypothetical protein